MPRWKTRQPDSPLRSRCSGGLRLTRKLAAASAEPTRRAPTPPHLARRSPRSPPPALKARALPARDQTPTAPEPTTLARSRRRLSPPSSRSLLRPSLSPELVFAELACVPRAPARILHARCTHYEERSAGTGSPASGDLRTRTEGDVPASRSAARCSVAPPHRQTHSESRLVPQPPAPPPPAHAVNQVTTRAACAPCPH